MADEKVLLNTDQGSLQGIKTTSVYHGVPMFSFLGIPYAKPNIGKNKFQISEAADSWTGPRDATKFKSSCVFYCMIKNEIVGDEDCLYLNVYTPDPSTDAKKAVIVFIHGGGYDTGSADDQFYGADFFIEKDIVVVTLEYRLGAVGFINVGSDDGVANAGLKDQVLALKWIQNNIINFGGCPDRVTILGHNAGASSVQYHMLSPMSQGLFKSAIIQSGSFACPWAISLTPKDDALMLATKLGITVKNTEDVMNKLKDISTKDIVKATMELMPTKNIFAGEMNIFAPSVEINSGQNVFLSNNPWEIFKYGDVADVPVIIGVTAQEAGIFTDVSLPIIQQLKSNYSIFIPKIINITDSKKINDISDSIEKLYFNSRPVNQDTKNEITNLLSDVIFNHGTLLTARMLSSRITSPVYEYLFNYNTTFGFIKNIFKSTSSVHGDELSYQFYSNIFNNKPVSGSPVAKKTDEILELWANFAKEGDPSAKMDIVKLKWEPLGNDENYLDIGENLSMEKSIFKERMKFWAGLYKNLLGDYSKLFE
ncbi:hypothetical protein HCN44_001700 [Aphidius gifuensis]|uniref:Carboxylesterase type B domain-containing protein n=1 Tax=Aphidius gifuensis TaxID=684658 RepID=A0A835CTI5_APHGI|nr:hypothetical protein HCN44_001700 [Aphidius gifuensis]